MILETTGDGPLGAAVRRAIQGIEPENRHARADDPDLFMEAIDCRAIVATLVPNMLDARLESSLSLAVSHPSLMRAVVKASNAPGVRLVVAIVPSGERYADEELVLKKHGVPYVILRCAPLVEEVAHAADFHVTRSVWLARGKSTAISSAESLEAAIRQALIDESLQGSTLDVPFEEVDLTEAIQRAAHLAGAEAGIRATSPRVSAFYRRFSRWLGLAEPAVAVLYDRMLSAA